MDEPLNSIAIVLVTFIIALPLPLLIVAYYRLRLGRRRENLKAKIREMDLEREYLKVFQRPAANSRQASAVQQGGFTDFHADFDDAFDRQFHWDNRQTNFLLPLLLTFLTTAGFAVIIGLSLQPGTSSASAGPLEGLARGGLVAFAVAGAMLYVFPLYVSHYGSFSLNPLSVLDLLGKLWLSVILGFAVASVVTHDLQTVAAFLGGLIPLATLDLLKKRVLDQSGDAATQGEPARRAAMLDILDQDEDLMSQLDFIGIRSVLELAYENPLKIFIETDLNLEACIYLADRANLFLYVPDREIRDKLSHFGIKTAVDLMTQTYEYDEATGSESWLDTEEEPPPHLAQALEEISRVAGLQSVQALRNLIDTMSQDPKLTYLLSFWHHLNRRIERVEEGDAIAAVPQPVPAQEPGRLARPRPDAVS